jgi:phosphatidylserine decarboxylase
MIKIAKQGWKFIGIGAVVASVGVLWPNAMGWFLIVLGIGFAGFCSYFFRDPDRPLPNDTSKIYSPGDGTVLSVAREGPGNITTVRIFLSIFDVHVQRAPCSGRVDRIQYVPGSFRMAMRPEANVNERNIVRIVGDGREPVLVEQIAGFVARRIECWTAEGNNLRAGERYGLIRFGSQAAVHLPEGVRPAIKAGDRAIGGVTVIGEWIKAS